MSRSKKDQKGGHSLESLCECLKTERVSPTGRLLGYHDLPKKPYWRRFTHKVVRRALRDDLNLRLKESY